MKKLLSCVLQFIIFRKSPFTLFILYYYLSNKNENIYERKLNLKLHFENNENKTIIVISSKKNLINL